MGVLGVAFGAFLELDPALMGEQARVLGRMVTNGVVRPQIGARFAFEGIPEAPAQLESGDPGQGRRRHPIRREAPAPRTAIPDPPFDTTRLPEVEAL